MWGLSAIRERGHVLGSERNWRVDWRLLLLDDMLERFVLLYFYVMRCALPALLSIDVECGMLCSHPKIQ